MSRWKSVVVEHPGRVTPGALRWIRRWLGPATRGFHRPTLEGLENLPESGPYLLVANHSGGLALAEIFSLMGLWADRFGAERPLAGFAHPLGLRIFPASAILGSVGAIPSTYDSAFDALRRGVPLLVFPGGDHEAMRPLWQAGRVDFGGRVGFLRIARQAGVPIVPLGIRGSHLSVPIVWRSRHVLPWALVLPRLLGIKRWPLTALGLAGAAALVLATPWNLPVRALVAAGWLTSPLIFLPVVPSTIRFRIGQPIDPTTLFADPGAGDEALVPALARIEAAVQALVSARG